MYDSIACDVYVIVDKQEQQNPMGLRKAPNQFENITIFIATNMFHFCRFSCILANITALLSLGDITNSSRAHAY